MTHYNYYSQRNTFDAIDIDQQIEALEGTDPRDEDEQEELDGLLAFREEAQRYVGSAWKYGVTFIRDSYFETYAQELAEDIGAIGRVRGGWPLEYIDWKSASDALKAFYDVITLDGEDYWVQP